jgi:hypothetical protein
MVELLTPFFDNFIHENVLTSPFWNDGDYASVRAFHNLKVRHTNSQQQIAFMHFVKQNSIVFVRALCDFSRYTTKEIQEIIEVCVAHATNEMWLSLLLFKFDLLQVLQEAIAQCNRQVFDLCLLYNPKLQVPTTAFSSLPLSKQEFLLFYKNLTVTAAKYLISAACQSKRWKFIKLIPYSDLGLVEFTWSNIFNTTHNLKLIEKLLATTTSSDILAYFIETLQSDGSTCVSFLLQKGFRLTNTTHYLVRKCLQSGFLESFECLVPSLYPDFYVGFDLASQLFWRFFKEQFIKISVPLPKDVLRIVFAFLRG